MRILAILITIVSLFAFPYGIALGWMFIRFAGGFLHLLMGVILMGTAWVALLIVADTGNTKIAGAERESA